MIRALRRAARWVARSAAASMMVVALVSLGLSATLSRVSWPVPLIQDEFCYLLQAETFARGRATNPPHPMWRHFESPHVLHRPTYTAKYPPAQGLMLAAGLRLGGDAAVGAWLGVAAAAAAITWMLRAWVPPLWALTGGLVAAFSPTALAWSQNYWGGAVAATGGALLIGAMRRLINRPRPGDGVALGAGLALLANSRPYEGLALTALAALAVLTATVRGRVGFRAVLRAALPAALVLLPVFALLAWYNAQVTGSPLTMPYALYDREQLRIPLFFGQQPRELPPSAHPRINEFNDQWLRNYLAVRTPADLAHRVRVRAAVYGARAFPLIALLLAWKTGLLLEIARNASLIPLQLPLFVTPRIWLDRRARLATALLAGFAPALVPIAFEQSHYAAPAAALVIVLTVHSLRHLRAWRLGGRRVGRPLARASLALFVAWFLVIAAWRGGLLGRASGQLREIADQGLKQKPAIAAKLEALGGKHLVIVRYAPGERLDEEWVYNGPDLDGSPVLWARGMGPQDDRELIDFYGDRRAWRLDAGRRPPELVSYPREEDGPRSLSP